MIKNFASAESYLNAGGSDIIDGIECDVTHCHYNISNRKCSAGHIKVGPQDANTTKDTLCATFRSERESE